MNAKAENAILKAIALEHYNNLVNQGSAWQTVYAKVEKVTPDGKLILTGIYSEFYTIRDCWAGDNREWSDWTGTIDGHGPIGEQHTI